jgi:tRNA (cmo5U34)-methyltransferase
LALNTDKPSEGVARHFETEWHDYDQQIRVSIPYYDQAFSAIVDVVEASDIKPRRILDLGVGTGNLADLLLKTWPQAHLTGIDLVQDFIDIAQKRLSKHGERSTLVRIDVADFDFAGEYDLVVSSFMVHHLTDEVKRITYGRGLSCLRSQGTLINADYVDSASPFYSRVFYDLRLQSIQEQGGSTAAYIEHQRFEIPTPMELQLNWLQDIGFIDIECFWKYLNLAIFGGRKA